MFAFEHLLFRSVPIINKSRATQWGIDNLVLCNIFYAIVFLYNIL